jgi:crossover junction endodeoxyribonuclease RuvC
VGTTVIAVGVDPGTLRLGWGVVAHERNAMRHIAHGVIALDGREPLARRLQRIEAELGRVLTEHRPEVGSVETLFFHKDAQAAAKLGHARGVVLLSLARAGIEVAEYAPARVKKAIAGHGQADKRQMALMIRALLRLDQLPAFDAADALALAVTHLRFGSIAAAAGRSAIPPELLAALGRRGKRSKRQALRLAKPFSRLMTAK